MNAAAKLELISVDDYLAGEATANYKHEYVDGHVFAMVGGTYAHSLVASNVLIDLGGKLRGKPCRPLNSDTKIRIQTGSRTKFYYPDVSVVCRKHRLEGVFQDKPSVIVEVLSPSTQRIDEGEKLDAYRTIDTLSVYILLRQDVMAATVYRRSGTMFAREIYVDDAIIPLPEIETDLSLMDVYADVEFVEETNEE